MLILASKLSETPVMGLQTGSQLATIGLPVLNPANLQIVAYNLENNSYSDEKMLLRIEEIRELSRIGFIIDSGEDFILPTDVIRIKELLDINFNLFGKKVVDEKNRHLGKVSDFTISLADFTVQQLIISRPFFKSFGTSELTIHRNRIVEIDDEKITIDSEFDVKPIARAEKTEKFVPNYVNPFREN